MTRPGISPLALAGRVPIVAMGLAMGLALALVALTTAVPMALSAAAAAPAAPGTERILDRPCTQAPADPTPSIDVPWAQRMLGYERAWSFSRGRGVKVAVIDTGVARHRALAHLIGLDDLVHAAGHSTEDCDGHGTLVAGIIAARATDGFAGVAPGATILSIRQTSARYRPIGSTAPGVGDLRTLVTAIGHATRAGASVVNISIDACAAMAGSDLDAALVTAMRGAPATLFVIAAGNLAEPGCPQNRPGQRRTLPSPAHLDLPNVLTVAAVDADGRPAPFSLTGDWVDLAAPGVGLTSLAPGERGVIDEIAGAKLNGTSYAAPFVSGTAALVLAEHPGLSGAEVAQRLRRTAQRPAGGPNPAVGFGLVDPLAAVSAPWTDAPPVATTTLAAPSSAGARAQPSGPARQIALLGTALAGVVLAAIGLVAAPKRRRLTRSPAKAAGPGPIRPDW